MEQALNETAWLAGNALTLADLALVPYVNRLEMLGMHALWSRGRRPAVSDWFDRMRARASFAPSLTDCCPPALTADLKEFGSASWPDVEAILSR
jgi:glutathione S-transferase